MMDVLEQLVADGKYREAIKLAEQILSGGVEGPVQLVEVQYVMLVAHSRLQEWEAALVPGDAALRLAEEIGEWDWLGKTAVDLSAAYSRLGQYEAAVSRIFEYISHIGQYREASSIEVYAWFNLGQYYLKLGKPAEAVKALTTALTVAERRGDLRNAHGLRHALIDASLKAHQLGPIPRLLARSMTYLRHNPEGGMMQDSWAYHMRLRAEYALATERPRRATAVALRGLERSDGAPHHACRFHIVLAKVAHCRNWPLEAVGHALAAQAFARVSGRPDVEAEASEVLYQMTHAFPDAVKSVDRYYYVSR